MYSEENLVGDIVKIGLIGTGLMGSSLAKCLSNKGYQLVLYNRTRVKAEKLAEEIGGVVKDNPLDVYRDVDIAVGFLADDEALYDIVFGSNGLINADERITFINASTVNPMTSLRIYMVLKDHKVDYLEAPVMGSVDSASECRLLSIVAGEENVYEKARSVIGSYSFKTYYVGSIPNAMVLKLAINNIGLAMPALLAESLSLLKAYGIDLELFRNIVKNLWFGEAVERYWVRIFDEKPPHFKMELAGKDYWYIASALKSKRMPSSLAETISSMYMIASRNGFSGKDYPLIAKYYIELARKPREE